MNLTLHIGIDFAKDYVMVSYYSFQMNETETISTIAGSQKYKIPFSLAKKQGVGQWFFGEEAEFETAHNQAIKVQDLMEKACLGQLVEIEQKEYEAADLLALFFQKILMIAKKSSGLSKIETIAFCLEDLSKEKISLMQKIAEKLNINKKDFFLMNRKESFYYYALSQKKEFWQKDCAVFYMQNSKMICLILNRNKMTNPQIVEVKEYSFAFDLTKNMDEIFCDILAETINVYEVGMVYLVGDIFDEPWMVESKKILCKNRRVFVGKNLFTKGACFSTLVKSKLFAWPFTYLGENKMQFNLCLQVDLDKREILYSLVNAGENWYEAQNNCEIILKDKPVLSFILEYPDKSKEIIEEVELTDLPNRPNKATRLRIHAIPQSSHEVKLLVKDLGFGDFFPSSGKNWEKQIRF